ncbi:F0F1 ATP synthase subunit B [Fimbriimonas ginsengisoli]|uniref:ATP synthase subunit b n=1 Tax=Fimbriimonas ginsengisoli Gsoil 348 TaxID=661478 RepID=A0A068NXH0_FIMGI|nr:F0F1 ATP synthase subunit B [Fimbriimonas ginsengisoli]AIE88116.1 ATP synthase F0, subunit B [Fimbriimonas ginsengisoli Gsoil 348]
MSTSDQKPSAAATWRNAGIGVVLMVVGTYVSANHLIKLTETLKEQGLELDFGMTLATIGVLLILFPLLRGFFIVPLQDAIRERNTNLERTFSEAEELRSEMQRMRVEYERRLVDTEAQAREQIQGQIREAQQLRTTLMDEATQKTNALVAQAQQEIAAERDRLVSDLRGYVVDLALGAAEKVVRENMDTDRNRRLVNEFIDQAEVVR